MQDSCKGLGTNDRLAEEQPNAQTNVDHVVDVVHEANALPLEGRVAT